MSIIPVHPLAHDPQTCGLPGYGTRPPPCPGCAALSPEPERPPRPEHRQRWADLVADYPALRSAERHPTSEPTPPEPMGMPELARLAATAQREPGRSILRALLVELLADDMAALAREAR